MKNSFLYKWSDILTSKIYIGVHKGTPDDGYICSSKIMLDEYRNRPTDFKREILLYGTLKECQQKETDILKKDNAAKNPLYYNQSNGADTFYHIGPHTDKVKRKISENTKVGMKQSKNPPGRKKGCVSNRKGLKLGPSWNKGLQASEETKKKMSITKLGKPSPRKGAKLSEETKRRISLSNKGQIPWNKGL